MVEGEAAARTIPGNVEIPSCSATPVPQRAVQKYDAADGNLDFVQQMVLEHAARKAIRKVIGKATNALGAARRLVNRARKQGVLPEGCASAALDLIDDLRARAQEAKQSLKR